MRGYLFLAENQRKIGPGERQKLHFLTLLSQKTSELPLPQVAIEVVKPPQKCQVLTALMRSKPEHGVDDARWVF